ncbi:MAG: LamG domain-containing protein [Armatimonadota bacterium]
MPGSLQLRRVLMQQPPARLLRGLVGLWELGEASGVRVSSYGARPLTDNNTVGSTAGKVGDAAWFVSANSEYLSRVNDLLTGPEWTVALWVKFDSLAANRGIWCLGSTPLDGAARLFLQANSTALRIYAEGSSFRNFSGPVLAVGTWYHIVLTRDSGRNIRGYVNGVEQLNTTLNAPAGNSANFYLGAAFNGHHDGPIDQLIIWDWAHAPSDVSWLSAGRTWPEIRAYRG